MNAQLTQKLHHFLHEMSQSGKDMNGSYWIPRAVNLLAAMDADRTSSAGSAVVIRDAQLAAAVQKGYSRRDGIEMDAFDIEAVVEELRALLAAVQPVQEPPSQQPEQEPGQPYMFKLPGDWDWHVGFAPLPDGAFKVTELEAVTVQQPVAQENKKCTCPSGDGSLRWPCEVHPPVIDEAGEFDKVFPPATTDMSCDEYDALNDLRGKQWLAWTTRAELTKKHTTKAAGGTHE